MNRPGFEEAPTPGEWSHEEVPKVFTEVRERAVRMVQEHRHEHPSQWAAIESISSKIGCVPQTLHAWVRQQRSMTASVRASRRLKSSASKS